MFNTQSPADSRSTLLSQVATINPRINDRPASDSIISFVPMSALSAISARVDQEESRAYDEVSKGYTAFQQGDLLVAKITPCFQNNKIGQATISRAVGFGSTEFHVIRANELADPRYLLHFLRQDHIRLEGERKMTGSAGQRRIPEHFLSTLDVPLPLLPEQRRIAAILDQADALRVKRRAALAQLDEMAQAIFVEMFGDPIRNPLDLSVDFLGNFGSLDRGISRHRPRNDPKLLGGSHPFIQTGDVSKSSGYIKSYDATYSDFGAQQSKIWPVGTLCITIAANIARVGLLTFDAYFPDSVVGFRGHKPGANEYVRVWFGFIREKLEQLAPESTQKNINLAILRALPLPIPDDNKMEEFARRVKAVNVLRETAQNAYRITASLFTALQHRAFTGAL